MKNTHSCLIRIGKFFLLLVIVSCTNNNLRSKAKIKSEELLDAIGNGNATNLFPTKYFPPDNINPILDLLKNNCDFANRKGVFVNDFYVKNFNDVDQLTLIYEYYLKCNGTRILITYLLKDSAELFAFRVERFDEPNPMIIDQSKRLWKGADKAK